MLDQVQNIGIELFNLICVITLLSYFFIRTKVFKRVYTSGGSIKDRIIIILFFGALSIYGNMSNIWLYGSQANVRNFGPVIAGLMFGPWIGLGAAVIGALFRYSLGGITAIPCSLTTLIAGILAGIVWILNKKRYVGTLKAIIFIILIEVIDLVMMFLIVGRGPAVMSIIEYMWVPMLPLYIAGISIFSIIYNNYFTEQKNREELELRKIETKSAIEIQKGFLPKSPPLIQGYDIYACTYPARDVGGDFFDYIPLDDGSTGLVIADVSGKSVPAAIFMALSCTTVRVLAQSVKNPHLAVSQVNSTITRYAENGMFFSMFYSEINPENGILSYVNAGHPSPLIIRNTGTVEELILTGPIVGFLEDHKYAESSVSLDFGDMMVCYTDGVTEAQQHDGKMFGKGRLIETSVRMRSSTSEEIITGIINEINQFVGDITQFDDITLLIVKKI